VVLKKKNTTEEAGEQQALRGRGVTEGLEKESSDWVKSVTGNLIRKATEVRDDQGSVPLFLRKPSCGRCDVEG
jgi:hypothetical protein